jgi:hypothetical protein
MAAPIHRRITRWIIDRVLWDADGIAPDGFWRGLWAARKLLAAVAGAALLTWVEWVKHHPPEIAIVAAIHFVFVFALIALLVYIGQWFGPDAKKSPGKQPNNTDHL